MTSWLSPTPFIIQLLASSLLFPSLWQTSPASCLGKQPSLFTPNQRLPTAFLKCHSPFPDEAPRAPKSAPKSETAARGRPYRLAEIRTQETRARTSPCARRNTASKNHSPCLALHTDPPKDQRVPGRNGLACAPAHRMYVTEELRTRSSKPDSSIHLVAPTPAN